MPRPSAGALALLLLAVLPAVARAQCPDGSPPPCGPARVVRPRVMVRDFPAADTADTYLAAGIAEDLRAALLGSRAVTVVSPNARGGADYVVSGTLRRSQDGVVLSARVERSQTAEVLWTQQLRRPARELPGLAGDVATRAMTAIGIRGTARGMAPAEDPVLYDLFLRIRHQLSRRTLAGLARAYALSREAIARDSTSPLGWVGVARTFERANRFRFYLPGVPAESALALELAAADRAVELAPRNPEVLVMQGNVATDVDPLGRTGAMRAYRAAIALDSGNVDAWKGLGFAYAETGDAANARVSLRRAAALDPDGAETLGFIANMLFLLRDLDSAAAYAERAVAADPNMIGSRSIAGQVALWTGRMNDAEAHFSAADRLGAGDRVGYLGLTRVYLARGDSARARAYVAANAPALETDDPSAHLAVSMADAWLAVGDTAKAFSWLERYHPRRDIHFLLHVRGEPAFDGLRNDPRFVAIAGRP